MQSEVFRRVEEDSTLPVRFSLQTVQDAINDGYEEMSAESEFYERTGTITLQANTTYYDLSDPAIFSDDILTLRAVRNPQTGRWLRFRSYRDMDEHATRAWQIAYGESDIAILRSLWWLGVYPKVQLAAGILSTRHSAMPPRMTLATDTPAFPEEYHLGPVEYALSDLWCQSRQFRKGDRYYQTYQNYLLALKEYVDRRTSTAGEMLIGR